SHPVGRYFCFFSQSFLPVFRRHILSLKPPQRATRIGKKLSALLLSLFARALDRGMIGCTAMRTVFFLVPAEIEEIASAANALPWETASWIQKKPSKCCSISRKSGQPWNDLKTRDRHIAARQLSEVGIERKRFV